MFKKKIIHCFFRLQNIVILGYGQNNTQGLGTRKTQDIINLSSNYGRKFSKN